MVDIDYIVKNINKISSLQGKLVFLKKDVQKSNQISNFFLNLLITSGFFAGTLFFLNYNFFGFFVLAICFLSYSCSWLITFLNEEYLNNALNFVFGRVTKNNYFNQDNFLFNNFKNHYHFLNKKSQKLILDCYEKFSKEEAIILESAIQNGITFHCVYQFYYHYVLNYIKDNDSDTLKKNRHNIFTLIDILRDKEQQEILVNNYLQKTDNKPYRSLILNNTNEALNQQENEKIHLNNNPIIKQI